MLNTPSDWVPLQPILHEIILQYPNGVSEHEVFELLKSPPYTLFSAKALRDPLSLFQSHFILFNALYQLQGTWLQDKVGLLQIDCRCICYRPWQSGQEALVNEDKLRTYYLDWANLKTTDQSQVEAMLDSFWQGFSGQNKNVKHMPDQQALDLLNLQQPYTHKQLKHQYRKMLHQSHPDKGGSHHQTILLHNAYQQLK